jgi:hypothetical protein
LNQIVIPVGQGCETHAPSEQKIFFRRSFFRGGDADDEMKPSQEHIVDLGVFAGGEDRNAGVFLDSLQEIIDLNVGVTIVAIMHLGALPKERIGFVEKEDRTTSFRRIEDAMQILLRLAIVFRNEKAQIDAVQVLFQIAGQSLGDDERADPVFASEQNANAFPTRRLANALPFYLRSTVCANEGRNST